MSRAVLTLLLSLAACASGAPAPAAPPPATTDALLPQPSIAVTAAMGSPHIGDSAPSFELPDQNGKRVSVAAESGSVLVLAFVASFCPFSKAEQPHLDRLARDYANQKVRVVAIGIKEPEADYRAYLARMPMALPVLRDEDGAVALRFTPPGAQPDFKDRTMALVTSNLIIDPAGKIRFFTVLDTVHFDAELVHLRRALDRVLAERGT